MTELETRFGAKDRANMASLPQVARYWMDRHSELRANKLLTLDWGEPFCFRCGWLAPVKDAATVRSQRGKPYTPETAIEVTWRNATMWLDRAHLHDHWTSGDGSPANIVPLCHLCHIGVMPPFDNRDEALAWVLRGYQRPKGWQQWTDARFDFSTNPRRDVGRTTLMRAERDFYVARDKVREVCEILDGDTSDARIGWLMVLGAGEVEKARERRKQVQS